MNNPTQFGRPAAQELHFHCITGILLLAETNLLCALFFLAA